MTTDITTLWLSLEVSTTKFEFGFVGEATLLLGNENNIQSFYKIFVFIDCRYNL